MKQLLYFLATVATLNVSAQTIQQGDNLRIEFSKIDKHYFFKAPAFTNWTEGADMLLIGAKPKAVDCDFLFIALKDTTLIGVLIMSRPNVFMFDAKGNSILGDSSEFFILPMWCVKNKTKIIPTDKTVAFMLDKMYDQTMQADNGQLEENVANKYRQFQTDTNLANRQIVLLFDSYQNIVTETSGKGLRLPANICISLMNALADECLSVYNSIPVIVCIYMREVLQSAGMTDDARRHFKMSLQFYPKSIPLQVYNYQLEQDPKIKKEELADLKRKYPKHWMVNGL